MSNHPWDGPWIPAAYAYFKFMGSKHIDRPCEFMKLRIMLGKVSEHCVFLDWKMRATFFKCMIFRPNWAGGAAVIYFVLELYPHFKPCACSWIYASVFFWEAASVQCRLLHSSNMAKCAWNKCLMSHLGSCRLTDVKSTFRYLVSTAVMCHSARAPLSPAKN